MTKAQVQDLVNQLPEGDFEVDELMQRLRLLADLNEARRQIADGKGISHEQMAVEIAQWQK